MEKNLLHGTANDPITTRLDRRPGRGKPGTSTPSLTIAMRNTIADAAAIAPLIPRKGRTAVAPHTPLGEYLFSWRLLRGMSMSTMASRLGIDHSTLSCIEHGRRNVNDAVLQKLASLTGDALPDLYRAAGRWPRP